MDANKAELIDAYLMGNLSNSELQSFENQLSSDPNLQSEVSLQRDIMSSFQNSRKEELKRRLANIDVKVGLSTFQKFGIAAATLSAGLLLTLGIVNSENNSVSSNANEKNTTPQLSKIVTNTENETPSSAKEVVSEVDAEIQIDEEVTPETIIEAPSNNTSVKTTRVTSDKNNPLTSPEPTVLFGDETGNIQHDDVNTPKSGYNKDEEGSKSSKVKIQTEDPSSKRLMYRYDGENLTLIGNFARSPYTLIELPKGASTELYLKFEGTYHQINEVKKAKKLEAITDKVLIKELSEK